MADSTDVAGFSRLIISVRLMNPVTAVSEEAFLLREELATRTAGD
jgi:hypothetical protein